MEVPSILLNRLLSEAAKKRASSLHLTIGSIPVVRINNQLLSLEEENIITLEMLDKMISSFLDANDLNYLSANKEIVVVKTFAGSFRFRINIFYQKNLPSVTFNYITDNIGGLAELGMPEILEEVIKIKSGLLILAGNYGSGKTYSAAVLLEEINKNYKKRIITLEEPIEYSFISKKSIIEQREVGKDTMNIASGLKYCLEEDVDIIYVGEVRKNFEEALPLIMELASGNSLVVLEVNAGSSIMAIEKVLNALQVKYSESAARYSLSDALVCVCTQRLLPKRGGGLALAAEVLVVNSTVKSFIREGEIFQIESIIQTSRKDGMISMEKSIQELIKAGEVRLEDV